ncbi:MAG: hypothetical protein Kow0083_05410 [Methylophaga sp.]
MKRPISLKVFLALAVLLLGVVIVVGYSLLSVNFFIRGLDSRIAADMQEALETYVDTVAPSQRQYQHKFSGYHISAQWEKQPETIREIFVKAPKKYGHIHKYALSRWFHRPDKIYFLIRLKAAGQSFFVSRILTAADASPLIGQQARKNRRMILSVSIAIMMALGVIIWLLMRRVSEPVSRLTHWTHQLSPDKLREPLPDFSYPELNEMASLIRNSLSSVHDTLEREQQFLRFTSHELRTPISIIRNNIELIHKIQQKNGETARDKQADIINRIDRASLTMQHLSETLLWLSREDTTELPAQTFRLDKLISELVEEMRYLLNNKPVEVELSLQAFEITQSQIASRIVIGNLIRNAFQHTWEGKVIIRQHDNEIEILNDCPPRHELDYAGDQGFGLGLQLTQQLCDKLGWFYLNEARADSHRVQLKLKTVP